MTQTAPYMEKSFKSKHAPDDCSLRVDITKKETQFTVVHLEGVRTCVISSQDAKDLALSILQVLGEAPPAPPTSPFDPCVRVSTTYTVEWRHLGCVEKSKRVDSSEEALDLAITLHAGGSATKIRMLQWEEATYRKTTTFDFVPPSGPPHWNAR